MEWGKMQQSKTMVYHCGWYLCRVHRISGEYEHATDCCDDMYKKHYVLDFDVAGKIDLDKMLCGDIILDFVVRSESLYMIIIMPVVHYCMGGLEIDCVSVVLGWISRAISSLCALCCEDVRYDG